jgi:hypothetical protein
MRRLPCIFRVQDKEGNWQEEARPVPRALPTSWPVGRSGPPTPPWYLRATWARQEMLRAAGIGAQIWWTGEPTR